MSSYKYGMTGPGVRDLQARLNKLGAGLKVDGDFGPATSRAVSDFQEKNGLKVDGVAGPETRSMLTRRIYEELGKKLTAAIAAVEELNEFKEIEELL